MYSNMIEHICQNQPITTSYSWSKLSKTDKLVLLKKYARLYCNDETTFIRLCVFLEECLNKHKFSKIKDVVYSKDTQSILSIPGLLVQPTGEFSLKTTDKNHVSTLKNLHSRSHRVS